MTEQAVGGGFDQPASAVELGLLLRRLRGDKTQQNIADHAKRHHLYVHRPALSAIERGHRLPTTNELRGILHGCGRPDLFDCLDRIRQQLVAGRVNVPESDYQHQPVSYLPVAAPGIPDEEAVRFRLQESGRGGRSKLAIAVLASAVVGIILVLVDRAADSSAQSSASEPPQSGLEISSAPGDAGRTTYNTINNHYQIYDTKKDRRAVAVIFYRPDRPSDFVGFQSCHEGAGNDCPGDLPDSVTGLLCMRTGVGLGAAPAGYTFGAEVCLPGA